jgi:hypothetical protein
MEDNPSYLTPLVPLPTIVAKTSQFHLALADAAQGGTQNTATKNEIRAELIELLKQQAYYVQTACGGSLSTLLSSGYEAVSTNRTQVPLLTPLIVAIKTDITGQLGLRLKAVANARAYQAQYSEDGLVWKDGGTFPSTLRVAVSGLTRGRVYTVQVRAVGGSLGFSQWSDPQSRMAN